MTKDERQRLQKEFFLTQKYQLIEPPIKDNENSTIYKVICLCMENTPVGILKIYHNRDITKLYRRLQTINYSSWGEIYDVELFGSDTYIAEEYVDGHTLEEVLIRRFKNRHPFSDKEIDSFAVALCDTVNVLHKLTPPMIHRDLKPANIILTNEKNLSLIKLIDFDTVREYDADKERDTVFWGTRQYSSPEQLGMATLGQTDCRSDIYSIGIILYEMKYGRFPTNQELIQLDETSKLLRIIKKCTQLIPENRYSSIDALKKEFLDIERFGDSCLPKAKFFSFTRNALVPSFILGVLFSLGMIFEPFLWICVGLLWVFMIYCIVLRSRLRAKYPKQVSILGSVGYWCLFLFGYIFFGALFSLFL